MKQLLCSVKRFSTVQVSEPVVNCSTRAYLLCAVMILSVPIRWFGAWIVAAVCHECFHCLAVLAAGKKIHRIRIDAFGAEIFTDPLKPVQSIFCALSGPLAGIILVLLAKFVPCIALCALVQSAFNLLPVHPLDGSVALRGFLRLLFSEEVTGKICFFLEMLIFGVLVLLCIFVSLVWKLGNLPLIFVSLFLLRTLKRKIPCKRSLYRVQ